MICSALLLIAHVAPPAGRAAEVPLRQKIDTALRDAWKREKVRPASAADDATFLRRAYIDLVGTIPTHDELAAFLADKDARKREKAVEKLLAAHGNRVPLVFSGHTHRARENTLGPIRGYNVGGDYHFKRLLLVDWPSGEVIAHVFGDPAAGRT